MKRILSILSAGTFVIALAGASASLAMATPTPTPDNLDKAFTTVIPDKADDNQARYILVDADNGKILENRSLSGGF
ncbi:hypothetical protein [Boudabousia marimammalium]|uniref:Uncharacterized protein n=1 Tax=Boudabousia marimammalium TaxID=156892 RepID=A0A1Q5PSE1_9ACTO|nr:hypothetical protein [Boudabousia marimammalium]OKL50497.1 hypothetical protein BM477_00545 [Boudabousia marimammalium]